MRRPNASMHHSESPSATAPRAFVAVTGALLAALLLLAALPVAAQPVAGSKLDLTLFGGYRLDGEVDGSFDFVDFDRELEVDEGGVYGVTLDFALNESMQIQVLASRQDTDLILDEGLFGGRDRVADLTLTTVHVGFVYRWTPGQAHPYVVASGGITNIDPDLPGGGSDARLSGSIGGGVKLWFGDSVALRLEGRLFVTDVDPNFGDDDERFRDDDEDLLVQPEGSVGVVFSF